jgi:PadR family transcriptional regulator, regulatory protein PadR
LTAYCIYTTISVMTGIERVTRQLLDLLLVLLEAYTHGVELHGYELKKLAGLSGPSTYRGLDRLEEADLVEARWENQQEEDARPRRRYYRLNPAGAATARRLLSERRPEALQSLGRSPRGWSPSPRPGLSARLITMFGLAGGAR